MASRSEAIQEFASIWANYWLSQSVQVDSQETAA